MNYFARFTINGIKTVLKHETLDDLKTDLVAHTGIPLTAFDRATEADPDKVMILGDGMAQTFGINRIHIYRGWQ